MLENLKIIWIFIKKHWKMIISLIPLVRQILLLYHHIPGGYSEEQALLNNTDWQDLITRTGISTYNDLSVSWG
mgnify:CR=1 FL=1